MIGNPRDTLARRVPGLSRDQIEEWVQQLNSLRLTKLERMRVTMTGRGAEDLAVH